MLEFLVSFSTRFGPIDINFLGERILGFEGFEGGTRVFGMFETDKSKVFSDILVGFDQNADHLTERSTERFEFGLDFFLRKFGKIFKINIGVLT